MREEKQKIMFFKSGRKKQELFSQKTILTR